MFLKEEVIARCLSHEEGHILLDKQCYVSVFEMSSTFSFHSNTFDQCQFSTMDLCCASSVGAIDFNGGICFFSPIGSAWSRPYHLFSNSTPTMGDEAALLGRKAIFSFLGDLTVQYHFVQPSFVLCE